MIDLPPQGYEQTIEAIIKCDIPRGNVRIKYEDYLQSDEVTISHLGVLSDEKLRCLEAAIHPFYILTIVDQAQQTAFYDLSTRDDRPKELAEAREWARSKRLLAKLPSYDPKQKLDVFTTALESACGLKSGSALMEYDQSSITIRPDFLLGSPFQKSAVALECLTKMFTASDAPEHGIRLVFIGNEAIAEENRQ